MRCIILPSGNAVVEVITRIIILNWSLTHFEGIMSKTDNSKMVCKQGCVELYTYCV